MTLTIGLHGVPDPSGRSRIHDHGMAVMRGGRVVWASELERRSRVKHDGAMPDHVEAWLMPWLRDREQVRLAVVNGFLGSNVKSRTGRFRVDGTTRLPVADCFAECAVEQSLVPGAPLRAFTVAHEVAHLGTCLAMFGPFRADSLLVHVDGGASESNASAWHYDGSSLRCIEHAWHPALKQAANNFNANPLSRAILGMHASQHLAMPGKLMGLAAYGEPDADVLASLIEHDFYREGDEHTTLRLTGKGSASAGRLGSLSSRDATSHVVAACMQRYLEDELLAYIRRHLSATGARHVYFSGGAALNVHANRRLERELPIDGLYVPPAPSDAGLALGAAAFLVWRLDGQAHAHSPFLNTWNRAPHGRSSATSGLTRLSRAREVAAAIAGGAVIGVFAGDGELGPRALGHRSLLCRADSMYLRRHVSEAMKRREWYRPVAPLMTASVAEEWLEPGAHESKLADWMLGAYTVARGAGTGLSGAVHVDGSVRAQVVRPGAPGLAHIEELLDVLDREHGVLAVINTSFNRSGEPIVHEPAEAEAAARDLGLTGIWDVGANAS